MKSILDPTFQYTPSVSTNLRKTFRRVRAEMAKREQHSSPNNPTKLDTVVPLRSVKK